MFQRILVGLDGSALGRQAFQAALELARLYRANLRALSVVEGPTPANRDTEESESHGYYRQMQANAVEQARAAGITLNTAIRHGHAARALVEFAEEEDADLIVIGATGHERPWSLTLGGTAWRVTTEAPGAVIVVRPPQTARWVRDIMVHHVSTVTPQTSLAEVVGLLLRRGVKAAPVVDERRRLQGIVDRQTLLQCLRRFPAAHRGTTCQGAHVADRTFLVSPPAATTSGGSACPGRFRRRGRQSSIADSQRPLPGPVPPRSPAVGYTWRSARCGTPSRS